MSFDPIFSGNNDWMFWPASMAHPDSAWVGHIPFAHWLVGALRPSTIVELGTHVGASYGGFCESVLRNRLATRCWAVDTWRGDAHSGPYDEGVFQHVRGLTEARYGSFSTLLRKTFDAALADFRDGSIDLLHIDGLHTYEAVRHDFESWKPKLSPSAVVLFHDTIVQERDFGVWRLWDEIRRDRPHFSLPHTSGLGVLQAGPRQSRGMSALFDVDEARRNVIRDRFARLGLALNSHAELIRLRRYVETLGAQTTR